MANPAIIGQAISSGIQDARAIQDYSMRAAQMRAIQKQDIENQMPITLDKIKGIIPPDMHEATFNMAKGMGIIENIDGQDFIRKGKFQEFGDAIKKNDILKANLLEQTIHGISAKQEPLLKEFQALKQEYNMSIARFKYEEDEELKTKKDEKSGKEIPPDMEKVRKIREKSAQYQSSEQYKKMISLGEQLSQLEELKMRRTQGLGFIDEQYKQTEEKVGVYAILVRSGQMSYEEALHLAEVAKAKITNAGNPNQTEEQLTARALNGDKTAQAILDAMQKRKVDIAKNTKAATVSITGDDKRPLQQTQFTDPETGLPLVFDRNSGTYKKGSVEGGKVAPRPTNPSAGEREKTAAYDVLRDQIKRIEESYNPKYVGLVSGQRGRITQYTDENEAAFRQLVLDVKDSLLRARSGAQINEQEYARLSKLVPDFTDSTAQFKGKLKSFKATFDSIVKEREKAQQKGGAYNRPEKKKIGRFEVEAD